MREIIKYLGTGLHGRDVDNFWVENEQWKSIIIIKVVVESSHIVYQYTITTYGSTSRRRWVGGGVHRGGGRWLGGRGLDRG
jgi:hypothetical protein